MGRLFADVSEIPTPEAHLVTAERVMEAAQSVIDSRHESVLIIGSFATGRHTLRSDVDLFALLQPSTADRLGEVATRISADTKVPVELHAESPTDWTMNESSSPAYHNAVRVSPRRGVSSVALLAGADPNGVIGDDIAPVTPQFAHSFLAKRHQKQQARYQVDSSRLAYPGDAQSYLELPSKLALRVVDLDIFGYDPGALADVVRDDDCQELLRLDREHTEAVSAAAEGNDEAQLPEITSFAREINMRGFDVLGQAVVAMEQMIDSDSHTQPRHVDKQTYGNVRQLAIDAFLANSVLARVQL
jgi:predicted nucleotidyltransferase